MFFGTLRNWSFTTEIKHFWSRNPHKAQPFLRHIHPEPCETVKHLKLMKAIHSNPNKILVEPPKFNSENPWKPWWYPLGPKISTNFSGERFHIFWTNKTITIHGNGFFRRKNQTPTICWGIQGVLIFPKGYMLNFRWMSHSSLKLTKNHPWKDRISPKRNRLFQPLTFRRLLRWKNFNFSHWFTVNPGMIATPLNPGWLT